MMQVRTYLFQLSKVHSQIYTQVFQMLTSFWVFQPKYTFIMFVLHVQPILFLIC